MTTEPRAGAWESGSVLYDGFISYSHSADDLLAPRLQAGLQKFAKPWWKRRAVRIFRDESSLAANPHLWSSITEALESSGWFVLLLSPDAANSEWVGKEIEHWKATKPADRILPVLTDGEFGWSDGDVTGSSIPAALQGVFTEEPRWVDLRFARTEEHLDLQNPTFSAAVADIASAIRGVPKDELESEEVRQHRRTVRTAWAAGGLVTVLAIAAVGFGIQSARNADEAVRLAEAEAHARADAEANALEAERNAELAADEAERADTNAALATSRELAASAINILDDDPELATLLAIHAIDQAPGPADVPVEVVNALWQTGDANRLADSVPATTEQYVAVSPDGRLIALSGDQRLTVLDSSTLAEIWTYAEDTVDPFTYPDFSVDGRLAVGIIDSTSVDPSIEPDDLPNRIVILDATTGELLHTISLPDCTRSELPTWSPDASKLALTSGADGCLRNDVVHWLEIVDTASWQSITFIPFPISENGALPRWDATGRLFASRPFEETVVFDSESFGVAQTLPWGGIGDVSQDGSTMLLGLSADAPLQSSYVVDVESGLVRDILPSPSSPAVPGGLLLSDDGRWAFVGAAGAYTRVYELVTGNLVRQLLTGPIESLAYDASTERLYTTGGRAGLKIWDLRPSVIGVEATGDLGDFDLVGSNSFDSVGTRSVFNAFDVNSSRWSLKFFDPASGLLLEDAFEDFRMLGVFENGAVFGNDSSIGRDVILDPGTGDRVTVADACEEVDEHATGVQFCAGAKDPWAFVLTVTLDGELLAIGRQPGGIPTGDVVKIDPSTGAVSERLTEAPRLPTGPGAMVSQAWAAGNTETGLEIRGRPDAELFYSGPHAGLFELSPTGTLLAFETEQTRVVALDTQTWDQVIEFEGSARVRGISFAPDGILLAVADLDSVSILDVASGRVVQDVGLAGVSDIHWLDAENLVVGTNDGVFGTLSISTEFFLRSVRGSLRRSFTDAECATYRIDPCPTLEEMKKR